MLGMLPMKKNIASMVLEASAAPKAEAPMNESAGLEAAAAVLMKAIEGKSTKDVAASLKSFIMMCMDEYEMIEGD